MGIFNSKSEKPSLNPSDFATEDVIYRDVCVVGGGASGTYTAIRLKDHKKSVVVIERNARLGGHAETYKDPKTGTTLDVGVIVFGHLQQVKDFFERFDIPLKLVPTSLGPPDFTDVTTGEIIPYTPPGEEEVRTAMEKYAAILGEYPEIQKGYNLEYPVPEELLLPFGKFIEKRSLGALIPTIFAICQGYTPLLEVSTLYIFKYFNLDLLNTLSKGFLMTERHCVGELYEKAASNLGSDVLLNANLTSMDRSDVSGPVKIRVDTPSGSKLIVAKKAVSTIPLVPSNMQGFDLSPQESSLFAQHFYNAYYSCIVRNTHLPTHKPIQSCNPANPYAIPNLPGVYTMHPDSTTGLIQIYYGSPRPLPEKEVRTDVVAVVKRIQRARGIKVPADLQEPEFVAFANHCPFNMMVSTKAIKNGFYKDLYNLQGQRHTWYNGASMHAQDSSVLWRFTEELLPRILDQL